MYPVRDRLRNFARGIANLIRWAPVIWNDYDWDYAPLLRIMEYKFSRMADEHQYRGHTVSAPQHVRQLRVCSELARRIRADDYVNPAALKQYKAYLGLMISKYIDHWWD